MKFSWEWLKAALIRAIRTFAQTALSMLTIGVTTLGEVDWKLLLSSSGLAALISILTSIVTDLPEVKEPDGTLYIDGDFYDLTNPEIEFNDPEAWNKDTVTLYVGKHTAEPNESEGNQNE